MNGPLTSSVLTATNLSNPGIAERRAREAPRVRYEETKNKEHCCGRKQRQQAGCDRLPGWLPAPCVHGGVLKKLLKEKGEGKQDYEVVALSGTSGGAICALLTWYWLSTNDTNRVVDLWILSGETIPPAHFRTNYSTIGSSRRTGSSRIPVVLLPSARNTFLLKGRIC